MADEIKTKIVQENKSVASKIKTDAILLNSEVDKKQFKNIYANITVDDPKLCIDLAEQANCLLSTLSDNKNILDASLEYGTGYGGVTDVKQNGASVVVNGIAYVTVPIKVSELINDKKYVVEDDSGNYLTISQVADIYTIKLHAKSRKILSSVSFRNPEYIAGTCIGIDSEHKISLLFDTRAFKIGETGKLEINEAYIATREYVNQKVTPLEQQLSIISPKVQELSIIASQHTLQISTLNNTVALHTAQLSTINTKIDEHASRLTVLENTKLDKDLSILHEASPNSLSIESRDNLLVYLYNTTPGAAKTALKAKLTELGYWDELND